MVTDEKTHLIGIELSIGMEYYIPLKKIGSVTINSRRYEVKIKSKDDDDFLKFTLSGERSVNRFRNFIIATYNYMNVDKVDAFVHIFREE
jgi:hypothetical protein